MESNIPTLTEKEKAWIRDLAEGKSTTAVAKKYKIAPGTFAHKINNLRARFQVSNMASLMAYIYKNNLCD